MLRSWVEDMHDGKEVSVPTEKGPCEGLEGGWQEGQPVHGYAGCEEGQGQEVIQLEFDFEAVLVEAREAATAKGWTPDGWA